MVLKLLKRVVLTRVDAVDDKQVAALADRLVPAVIAAIEKHAATDRTTGLDFVLEHVLRKADQLIEQMDALDTKAGFALGSAGILLTGITVLQAAVAVSAQSAAASRKPTVAPALLHWCAISAFVSFLAVTFCAWRAYRVTDYDDPPQARGLYNLWRQEQQGALGSSKDLRIGLTNRLLTAIEINQGIVRRKAYWVKYALRCFFMESAVLGVILVSLFFL